MSVQELSSVEVVAAALIAEAPAKKSRRARGDGGLRFASKRQLWIATEPREGRSPATFYGKTQQEAQAKRNTYKADVAAGRVDASGRVAQIAALPRTPRVGEWIAYWLEHEVKPRYDDNGEREGGRQPTTYEHYRWMASKHILPRPIARIQLDKLSVGDVEVWWESLRRAKVGMPSCYKAYVVLSGAIKRAITRRDVTRLMLNPATVFGADDRVRKPRSKKKDAPTPEGTAALFAAAEGERLALVLDLGIRLGLRRQEICALRFGDFDLARGRLYIRRRVNRIRGEGILARDGAKMEDESAVQVVPISNPQLWAGLLETHRQKLVAFAQANTTLGYWTGPEPTTPWAWLFPARSGSVMDPNEVFRWFKGIAAKAGQPDKTLHSLRHDCASLGITSGMSLWEVSKLLRHASTNITESVYGHITGAHETQLYSTVDGAVDAMLAPSQSDAASG